jgi:hypothetical protein
MDGTEQMVDDGYLDCPVCGGPAPAEVPECADGHGIDCPDVVCARCGSALFLDPILPRGDRVSGRRAAA